MTATDQAMETLQHPSWCDQPCGDDFHFGPETTVGLSLIEPKKWDDPVAGVPAWSVPTVGARLYLQHGALFPTIEIEGPALFKMNVDEALELIDVLGRLVDEALATASALCLPGSEAKA